MSFTSDEIKNIEIIAEGIEKVIEVISQQLVQFVYDRSTKAHRLREGKTVKKIYEDVYRASILYLTVSVPPSNLIRDIFAKLYWDKPEIAKDLKETYNQYQCDVSQLIQIKDADNLYDELFSIQYNLRDLAQTLQAGTKIAKAETENLAGNNKMPTHYVPCVKIAGIIRKRSDSIARTLKAAKYPVVKQAGKNYCDPEHAAVLFPKWKEYLNQ